MGSTGVWINVEPKVGDRGYNGGYNQMWRLGLEQEVKVKVKVKVRGWGRQRFGSMLNPRLETEVTMVVKSLNQMSWLRSGSEVRIQRS